ncbi:MAG: DUF4860 domain-containing protein [Oscillospiraceae bacterium]
MRQATRKHSFDGVYVLLVFGVFAASILLVLFTGAGSYQRLAERDAKSDGRRVAVQYVATKLRSNDIAGGIAVAGFSDRAPEIDTLFLRQKLEGTVYCTRIYYYDGAVRELFAADGEDFSPEDGQAVLPATGLSFAERDGLVTVTAADGDGTVSLTLALRSGEGAAA